MNPRAGPVRVGRRRIGIVCAALALLLAAGARPAHASEGAEYLIRRDAFGVPHIQASTTLGLFRGLGYAVAQDRLWQLELFSRTGQGTLSEILGPEYLDMDRAARQDGYTAEEIAAQLDALDADTRAVMLAYATGVNDRIADVMAHPDSLLPAEFARASTTPSPWNPERILAAVVYLARPFGTAGGHELELLGELERLGPEAFDAAYPLNDPGAPTTIDAGEANRPAGTAEDAPLRAERLARALSRWGGHVSPAGERALLSLRAVCDRASRRLGLPPTFGSFGLVVAPGRSASGAALLFGGPQTGEPEPDRAQLGMEVDLHGGGFDVSGMAVPGIPAVVIGRTASLAWTMTSGISDNVDIYIETLNPSDPGEYQWQGAWRRFETRTEIIPVAGSDAGVPFTVSRSVHGPVISVDPDSEQAFSRKRATWGIEGRFVSCLLAMDRARELEDLDGALPAFPLSFNVLAATASGHIGYWHAGLFQDRLDGVDPRLPHDGRGDEEWHGLLPFSALPRQIDPAAGYFANWNNKPVSWWMNGDNMPWVGTQHVRFIARFAEANPAMSFLRLVDLPAAIQAHGTWEEAVQLSDPPLAANIVPPGQSGFISRDGSPDAHFADQWPIYRAGRLKTWEFASGGEAATGDLPRSGGAADSAAHPAAGRIRVSVSPRPASRVLEIRLVAPAETRAEVAVFDSAGRSVRRIFAGMLAAGERSFLWNARDDAGHAAASGIYFARVRWNGGTESAKIVLGN